MATFDINTYIIWVKRTNGETKRSSRFFNDEKELKEILDRVIDVTLNLENGKTHRYEYEEGLLFLTHFTGDRPDLREFEGRTPKDFCLYLNSISNGCITIRTKYQLNGQEPIASIKVVDWSKTISDLEIAGAVLTKPTDNILACDERKFWFENYDSNNAIDVDCLGTSLHQDLSETVLNRWRELFRGTEEL